MADQQPDSSPRRRELARLAYEYVGEHGLADLSLRPLAESIGTSTGVLMFLFGSKDGVVRAILAEARADELALLTSVRGADPAADLVTVAHRIWRWLAAPEHDRLLRLWVEAYGRSLVTPDGPWAGFARATVTDWLAVLAEPADDNAARYRAGAALALLRGSMLDLLATGDRDRVDAAFSLALDALP